VIKAECSTSLLQSSVSHDPSEITLTGWFEAQETFVMIINVENSFLHFYFRILWWIERSKEQFLWNINLKKSLLLTKATFIDLQKTNKQANEQNKNKNIVKYY